MIEYYKIFYIVAKNKNITKASKELLISQPAVSQTIKILEKELGCILFVRSKLGVNLTHEGEVLLSYIEKAISIIDNAETKIKELINLNFGEINIGASKSTTKYFLLPIIANFHQKYPNINIKIHTDIPNVLISKLKDGIIDCIITGSNNNIPKIFKYKKLKTIHEGFFANNNFAFLKDKILTLKELSSYPLVLLSKGSGTRSFIDEISISNKVDLIPTVDVASSSLVIDFTKIGLGIGFICKEFIENELKNDELFEVKLDISLRERTIGLIYKEEYLSHSAKSFCDEITNCYK